MRPRPHPTTPPLRFHPPPRAKRGNSYEPSDVKAALDFYSSGSGDMPYEAEFAVNRFGTEDAAFFDDIDNNEGYAASEYLSAGIEEAAPKQKQRGPADEDDAFQEALEEFDQVGPLGGRGGGSGAGACLTAGGGGLSWLAAATAVWG